MVLRYPGGDSAPGDAPGRRRPPAASSTPTSSASTTPSTRATGRTWSASGSTARRCASSSPARARSTPSARTDDRPLRRRRGGRGARHRHGARQRAPRHRADRRRRPGRAGRRAGRPTATPPRPTCAAIGGVLYFALTGHWPHAEAGPSALPDAVRDGTGAIAAPRQIRAGVPAYLDDLTMDLLDRRLASPPADVAGRRAGPARRGRRRPVPRRRGRPAAVQPEEDGRRDPAAAPGARSPSASAGLLVVATAGLLLGISVLSDDDTGTDSPPNNVGAGVTAPASPGGTQQPAAAKPTPLQLTADQVRIVDPPTATAPSSRAWQALVDGDRDTAWETDSYFNPPFGGQGRHGHPDRPRPSRARSPRSGSYLNGTGASAELLTGHRRPGRLQGRRPEDRARHTSRIGDAASTSTTARR